MKEFNMNIENCNDGRISMSQSIFMTLINHDYLIDARDEKINKILS